MKLIFTSYVSSPEYSDPHTWLKRIEAYTGILAELSKMHSVISIERINYEGELDQNGVHYYFIKLKKRITRFPWRLHGLIKKLNPDVVFINGFIFPLQIIQLRLTFGRKVKIIILHRAEKPYKGIKKYLQRLADTCINAFLFTSSEFGEQWVRQGNISNIKKVYEVIQASSVFHPGDRQSARIKLSIEGSPVFLWVGRLTINKDPITVIKAFAGFLHKSPNAKLYMIYQSDDLLPELINLINSFKLMNAVHLVGKVAHEDLQTWYNSADFIISGSHYEGSGIAVSEAMCCGCIPIVTNIISYRKMTGAGKCGLLYEPGNEKDLLSKLSAALRLDLDAERIKVLQQFNNELSFEVIAKKINRIID